MRSDFLEMISKEFCGDDEYDSFYEYKTGPELINFFNSNYGFNDTYGQGFPSRWIYVRNKLEILSQRDMLTNFFMRIMSIEFHISEKSLNAVETVEFIEKLKDHWNMKLRPFRYQLSQIGESFHLTNFDEDFELIGEGGFAEVYYQNTTGNVLKILKRENLNDHGSKHRFKREYVLTKSLSNIPGIIQVFDFNESEYFYTMEKCDCTLHDFLEKTPLSIKMKESIALRIISIMAKVHQKNIVHRDISANNIFLKGNNIIIADFGLGKSFEFVFSHKTASSAQLGQIQYCAPEQLMNLADGGKYSDVYSLGRLINFIFANNPNDKNHKYKYLVEKATSLEIENRYSDASEMHEAFLKNKEYAENREMKEELFKLIANGQYNETVAFYIVSLNSEDLCKNIINTTGFVKVLCKHLEARPELIIETLVLIEEDMERVSKVFSDADNFADVAHYILKNNLSTYDVKEKAAKLLNYIAYSVNRFYAQDIVESLIEDGIEPMLEDILKNS